ncbi:flotillin-1-like [Palaemon carinicauda]|uniref:flotillin-1-like n=1 Tax=Palaemon carinicauda TaxID=392227 RepID=UPI0035B5D573
MVHFITCGPNEVLVVSGVGYKKPAMVMGGRVLFFPMLQRWRKLLLNVMTITISSSGVYTAQGVPIKVTGVAQVKISTQHPDILELACENFLDKTPEEISSLVQATLEGHQRGIMGTMTVEDIYKDRQTFNSRVFEVASKDLCNLGLQVLSYTIKDVNDDLGYLAALGMSRTSEVQRDARIGEALALKESTIQKSLANEKYLEAKYANETLKAKAQRDYMCQKAAYDQEVKAKSAEADLAFELQSCKTRQKIKEEEMETLVVEKRERVQLEEQEIQRRKKHLEATVMQIADAEKYRLETISAAQRQQTVLEAEAKAEANRLKGEAEAFAIEQRAKAEAIKMTNKAEAWKEYEQAAVLDMYLQMLPKMVAEIGSSLSNTKSIKMVSSGDSEVGALKLTNEVMGIASSVPNMVKNMTGIDIQQAIKASA